MMKFIISRQRVDEYLRLFVYDYVDNSNIFDKDKKMKEEEERLKKQQ